MPIHKRHLRPYNPVAFKLAKYLYMLFVLGAVSFLHYQHPFQELLQVSRYHR
jgi:hypothetical protein